MNTAAPSSVSFDVYVAIWQHWCSMKLGERIRHGRDAKGWTLADLAAASGVSRGTISNYENGRRRKRVSAEHIARIADALGIPSKDLLAPDSIGEEELAPLGPIARSRVVRALFANVAGTEQELERKVDAIAERFDLTADEVGQLAEGRVPPRVLQKLLEANPNQATSDLVRLDVPKLEDWLRARRRFTNEALEIAALLLKRSDPADDDQEAATRLMLLADAFNQEQRTLPVDIVELNKKLGLHSANRAAVRTLLESTRRHMELANKLEDESDDS